jgi:acetyl esterase/lipase
MRAITLFSTILLAACGATAGGELTPDAGEPDVPDGELEPDAPAGPQPTAACAADPTACLYAPPQFPTEQATFTFTDATRIGGARTIEVTVRFARTAPQPQPVMIWSHGGANGQTNSATALEEWATAAAEVGYFSIAIAHAPRTAAQRTALCDALGFDAAGCATFKFLSYDRPLDISFVIDRVFELAATPQFENVIDETRLGVGGHSAGAGGTLMIAGAPRDMNGQKLLVDPRPAAFVALSPQAPGSDGLDAAGYAQITRPTFIGTGRGDEAPPDTADGRASVFDHLSPAAPGTAVRIFVEDPAAVHGLFALETAPCAAQATLERCKQMRSWIRATAFAFLDAQLRGSADAAAFLASSNLAVASEGAGELSVR